MTDQLFKPDASFQKNAYVKSIDEYRQLWDYADKNADMFWGTLAKDKIDWLRPYDTVLNESKAPFYTWFDGGALNVAQQCVDRHIALRGDQAAIIWESELGVSKTVTYRELAQNVNRFANLMKNKFGISKGDRVLLYMPIIPEAVYAMLACAKIGAVHVIVFGGFSAEALHERIVDSGAKLIITADGASRHGRPYLLKPTVDDALNKIEISQCKVLVVEHNHQTINYKSKRDYKYHQLIKNESEECDAEVMGSEDPLFILHTSGSTGKPKGILHSTAGYILWAQYTTEMVFDMHPGDVFWCTADIGWITGHTYSVYGPLALGATTVLYEGVPTFPDADRWWQIIEKHKVTQFYTAPTAIRMLKKADSEAPYRYDLSSLKVIGSVGEPINPTAWKWYRKAVGGNRCPVVDTWWQTETGGHIIAPLPGAIPTKPGSATLPLPGIHADILDESGNKLGINEKGLLCITKPWPSMLRAVWGDEDRYKKTYFDTVHAGTAPVYFSGDTAFYDDNGYITITGRADDVINVSGHRVGTNEVESAIAYHESVAEVGVVSRHDEIRGEQIVAYVVTRDTVIIEEETLLLELNGLLVKDIGAMVKVSSLTVVPGLPKTRSGKVMRRILKSIARDEEITQDISTLDDPSLIEKIKIIHRNK